MALVTVHVRVAICVKVLAPLTSPTHPPTTNVLPVMIITGPSPEGDGYMEAWYHLLHP